MVPYFEVPDEELRWLVDKVNSRLKAPLPAEEILKYAREDFTKANLAQAALLFKMQDSYCTRCGACCRTSNPIDFTKEELRAVAKRLGTSYKRLKRKLRATPRGDGRIMVPGKPCPFLEGRNHCTIYDLRPIVCRCYPLGKGVGMAIQGKGFMMPSSSCEAVQGMMTDVVLAHIALGNLLDENDTIRIELDSAFLDKIDKIREYPKAIQFQMLYEAMEVTP